MRTPAPAAAAIAAIMRKNSGLPIALQKAPRNYRKLVRLGVFGATIPYYICAITLRGTDLQGKTVVAPWFRSDAGRCTEP